MAFTVTEVESSIVILLHNKSPNLIFGLEFLDSFFLAVLSITLTVLFNDFGCSIHDFDGSSHDFGCSIHDFDGSSHDFGCSIHDFDGSIHDFVYHTP